MIIFWSKLSLANRPGLPGSAGTGQGTVSS